MRWTALTAIAADRANYLTDLAANAAGAGGAWRR
jgi:hypothetical protein